MLKEILYYLEKFNNGLEMIVDTITSPFEKLWPFVVFAIVINKEWRMLEIFFTIFIGLEIVDVKDKLKTLIKSQKKE